MKLEFLEIVLATLRDALKSIKTFDEVIPLIERKMGSHERSFCLSIFSFLSGLNCFFLII